MGRTRRLGVVPVLWFAAVVVGAACSVGSGPPVATDPPSGAVAASGREPHCQVLNDAVEVVQYHLGLMLTLDDAEAYAAARESDAPFRIDPGAFRQAIAILAALSGVEQEVDRLRRLAGLLEQNLGVEDPFRAGSTTGAQMVALAEEAFAGAQVVIDEGLRRAGCPVAQADHVARS